MIGKFYRIALIGIAGSLAVSSFAETKRRTLPVLPPASQPAVAQPAVAGATKDVKLVDVGTNDFDRVNLSEQGRAALGAGEFKWKHGQTEHFVVHFENSIFAQKVGRMAEFFYDYISADLKVSRDLHPGRSHIFIFNTKKDWETFQHKYSINGSEWVASWVRGPEMFLQQTGGGSDAADTLGHEMTHLIVNRFFDGQPPLAINEGVAEWYGEFAYSAFKGVKKSKKQEFRRLERPMPLGDVLPADKYPPTTEQVRSFYETAKFFVGFLMIRKDAQSFAPFFADCTRGVRINEALAKHYDFKEEAGMEKEFAKFAK